MITYTLYIFARQSKQLTFFTEQYTKNGFMAQTITVVHYGELKALQREMKRQECLFCGAIFT